MSRIYPWCLPIASIADGGEVLPKPGIVGVSERRNDGGGRFLLVFHRFQSIKLVAVVLPLAGHATAVPFFCFTTTSVVFLIPTDFLLRFSSRRRLILLHPSCVPGGKKITPLPLVFTVF